MLLLVVKFPEERRRVIPTVVDEGSCYVAGDRLGNRNRNLTIIEDDSSRPALQDASSDSDMPQRRNVDGMTHKG